jgi:hypothetical protein
MSYLPQEPITFINIKLTDDGRRMLSLGQLNFSKAIISDREINYGIDRVAGYQIDCSDRILSPKDAQPILPLFNFDGTPPVPFQSIGSARQIITASTNSTGFFTGSTQNWAVDLNKTLGYSKISYSANTPNGTTDIQMTGGTYFPKAGDLMFAMWEPIQNSGKTYSTDTLIQSGNSTIALWYRVLSASTGTSVVSLDRNLPDFGPTISTSNQAIKSYFYPYNGIAEYYGSATTVQTQVWNMNIVNTSSVIGTDFSISGYTSYGSIEYNGTKQYLGFSSDTRDIGIIHYSNNYSGNTYAEQLVEGTVTLDLPYVMWHNSSSNAGQGMVWGLSLTDIAGPTVFDNVAGTTYRYLRDGNSLSSLVVGRVYHKLKIMVITDPELLTALTYKYNRNFTLPGLILDSSIVPKYPLSIADATGLLQTGYSYYVTYVVENQLPYLSGVSFGYPQTINCNYISKIDGVVDFNGDPQYLKVNFASNGFPFMRNGVNMNSNSSYSGTGWASSKVQLLVNKVDNVAFPNMKIDNLPTGNWTLISNELFGGNGIYSGGSSAIDASSLLTSTFIVSNEDYSSGSTFVLNNKYSAFTMNANYAQDGITFGDESFFFGNVKADILATVFKTVLTVLAPDTSFNSTLNPSFDPLLDSDTFITEIGVLDSNNILVGVGKPTYPIVKNSSRYLAFQLEIDF